MRVYNHDCGSDAESVRSHPWTVGESDPSHRYYDFKAHPELVKTALEDFAPWSNRPAIQAFYDLVIWVNSPNSVLESNDCAFGGVHENSNTFFAKSLQCDGRIMLFYRDLNLNSSQEKIDWLEEAFHHYLKQLQPDLDYGLIGTSQLSVNYVDLSSSENEANGRELMLSFWSWGDTEDETMDNLHLLMQGLLEAIQGISGEICDATNSNSPT